MLIDAGPNAVAETVVDYLAAQGVETLDCVVGTCLLYTSRCV